MDCVDSVVSDGTYEHPYLVNAVGVSSLAIDDERVKDSWVECNTDTLIELMNVGYNVSLPSLDIDNFEDVSGYSSDDVSLLLALSQGDMDDIVSIEYVGEDEVQCIEVADDDHMYVTDGWIPTHNTSNIVFLKSTDDAMLDTLEKMSGKTHRTYAKSKSVTKDRGKLLFQNENQGNVTYETVEEPVLNYNRFAFLGERQSIVFRASDPPVLNRNQMILPMSWRLFLNKINHPGHDYTLQTIPTLSSASEFDARKNLPRFDAMVDKRVSQAVEAAAAAKEYADAFGYDDYAVEQLDPDVYSEAVMDIINAKVNMRQGKNPDSYSASVDSEKMGAVLTKTESNEEGRRIAMESRKNAEYFSRLVFAGGTISRSDLAQYDEGGKVIDFNHSLDATLIEIFVNNTDEFKSDSRHFSVRPDGLYDRSGRRPYITMSRMASAGIRGVERDSASGRMDFETEAHSMDDRRVKDFASYDVSDAFYEFLVRLPNWDMLANGAINAGIIASQQ